MLGQNDTKVIATSLLDGQVEKAFGFSCSKDVVQLFIRKNSWFLIFRMVGKNDTNAIPVLSRKLG